MNIESKGIPDQNKALYTTRQCHHKLETLDGGANFHSNWTIISMPMGQIQIGHKWTNRPQVYLGDPESKNLHIQKIDLKLS